MTTGTGEIDTPRALHDRLIAVEWIRRSLIASAPHCAQELSVLLEASRHSARGAEVLLTPQAFTWLDDMVRLIDRDAPNLLPEGQFAAHAAAIVNLTAGVTPGSLVRVRFDEMGRAVLPALDVSVDAGLEHAGRTCVIDLSEPNSGHLVEPLSVARSPEVIPPPDASPAVAVDLPDVDRIVARWIASGGRSAQRRDEPRHIGEPPTLLLERLAAAAIPATLVSNTLGTAGIRADTTIDALSLLSIRDPGLYAELREICAIATDRLSRRLAAHCAYIDRDFDAAARLYAELLIDEVDNTDLWRDFCWASRHSGAEEATRCWVMHPTEVVTVAAAVAFDRHDGRPRGSAAFPASAFEMIHDFLRWVGDDFH